MSGSASIHTVGIPFPVLMCDGPIFPYTQILRLNISSVLPGTCVPSACGPVEA